MAKNKLRYQDLGLGPDTDILPTSEPYLEFISDGQATSVNDLPVVVGITPNQDYLIVYIPGTGHRKILIEDIGEFFPAGGTAGQILIKDTNADFDVSWTDVPVGGLVDEGNTLSLIGDVSGSGIFDAQGDIQASTILELPNVVLMDGGGAFSTFPAEATGPYGVAGLQPAGGLAGQVLGKLSATEQDVGWADEKKIIVGDESGGNIITPDMTMLTFEGPGVELSQPTPGHIVAKFDNFLDHRSNEFCPQYPFTYVDGDTWRVTGLDRTSLFSASTRLHFYDGVSDYYGTITSSTFTGGNTDIEMAMESFAVLTPTIDEVCLARGVTDWQLLNVQPLGGTQMNDICVGSISSVTYWVVCGNGGELAYSTDKLATWTTVQLPTAYNLECVMFDPTNQRFIGGGGNSELFWSDDGINWFVNQNTDLHTSNTYDWSRRITVIQHLPWLGGSYGIIYGGSGSQYVDGFTWNYSTDQGVNWNGAPAGLNLASTTGEGGAASAGATPVYSRNGNSLFWDSAGVGGTTAYTAPGTITKVEWIPPYGGQFLITSNGRAARTASSSGYSGWATVTTDPWASADPINDFAFSNLLHPLIVCVGAGGKIAVSTDNGDNFAEVSNGFSFGANITDVIYSEEDQIFAAIADNGEIAVSVNGGLA